MPKSARYAGPFADARTMLEGLMSRWMIPLWWRYARAENMSWKDERMKDSGSDPVSIILASVRGIKGKMRTSLLSLSWNVSTSLMIDGCEIWFKTLTSRVELCGSTFRVSVMTFNATASYL